MAAAPPRGAAATCAARPPHRPDTDFISVSVGLGFHAQMTLGEAVAFCTQREAQLNASIDALTQRASVLKARIKVVMGTLPGAQAGRAQAAACWTFLSPHWQSR